MKTVNFRHTSGSEPVTYVQLSKRERQLIGALCAGLANKEIGVRLGITEGTVKVYFSRLFELLGTPSRVHLAMWALCHPGALEGKLVDPRPHPETCPCLCCSAGRLAVPRAA
jgi:DNA-binding NarL/FixJ family response regulator